VATPVQQQLTTFAFKFVGYPYVWAGEWKSVTPPGYCCGYQPIGGFDCSGFSWWVLKKNEGGYNAAQFRPYPGWSLPQRSSYEIAEFTKTKLTYAQLRPGNLVLTASDGGKRWQDVDHVGIYLGSGWMIHSTGDGPQLQWIGDGYYRDHFVWGRAL
jgi:cell wall-associated NlpC family hydrolase